MHATTLRIRNKALRTFLQAWLRPRPVSDLVRFGTDYGGWWVPSSAVRPDAVAYCAGAGEDISFDLELHQRGCQVTTFDPTPRAVNFVRTNAPTDERFRFVPVGWWGEDTALRFYGPKNPSHVSHSVLNLQGTSSFFTARVKPVQALMAELGDDHVDLIKMDIEGAEYSVIDSLLRDGPLPHVLCIEFDQPQPPRKTIGAVRRLRAVGYSLAHIDRWNYTFVRAGQ